MPEPGILALVGLRLAGLRAIAGDPVAAHRALLAGPGQPESDPARALAGTP